LSVILAQSAVIKFVDTSRRVLIQETISICRDAKDNKFLELAVNGDAKFIITGDQDLLILNPFRGIKIITPELLVSEFRNLQQENNT
jgi:predicted nucleic acid-binding protein